jgi:predicted Zn-dependent protease
VTCLWDEVAGLVRLANGDARLDMPSAGFERALFTAAPRLRRSRHRPLLYASAAAIVAVIVALPIWWFSQEIISAAVVLVPPAAESAFGKEILDSVPGERCTDPAGQAALDALTRRLTAGIDFPYPLDVSARNLGVVNAFALPGGHIVLLKGLIDAAQSPDEVAGVLAHELTHALKRHPTRGLIAGEGLSFLASLFGGTGTSSSLASTVLSMSYTREAESEADAGAVGMLQKAGIDTGGFVRFFERVSAHETSSRFGQLPNFFASHPPTAARIAAIPPSTGATTPALTQEQWAALKAICGSKNGGSDGGGGKIDDDPDRERG